MYNEKRKQSDDSRREVGELGNMGLYFWNSLFNYFSGTNNGLSYESLHIAAACNPNVPIHQGQSLFYFPYPW